MSLVDPTSGIGYAYGEVLPSADVTTVFTQQQDALDGAGGGAYTLTAPLSIAGDSVTVDELVVGNTISETSTLTPSSLTASVDNYAPSGHATTMVFRIETDGGGGRSITGLAGGAEGRIVRFVHIGTAGDIIQLVRESGSSTAANRFVMDSTAVSVQLADGDSASFWYDNTSSRWRLLCATALPT